MGSLLGQLIPTAIVGALAPVPIIVVITLLMSKGGLAKAVGFGAALVGVFAIIGAITLATASVNAGSTTKGSAVTGTIIAVLGVVFLVMALKQIVDTPDPDAPPPKFMTKLDSMSVAGATVFGLVLALINLKQLGIYVAGVSLIVQADVSTGQGWVALVILLVVIQLGVIAPVAGYVLARNWATQMLQGFRVWLVGHNRIISIVLGLVVGVWFLIKGVVQIA
jgi:Sap, sulfolipid-1-addressing protein